MKSSRYLLAALLVAALMTQVVPCRSETVYMIGNSLTRGTEPAALPLLAEQKSDELETGWHIKHGSSLIEIWTRPSAVNIPPSPEFGRFEEALPNHKWDAVVVQPYYGPDANPELDSNLENDVKVILGMIELTRRNPENADTRFYLFQSWPQVRNPARPFRDSWDRILEDEERIITVPVRDYYVRLLARLNEETDAEILMIPVAEVMYELDRQMASGEVPGYGGIAELITDKIHLNPGLGTYLSAATVYATLFQKSPEGLVKPPEHYNFKDGGDAGPLFTPEIYDIFHQTIWDVVQE